jgi:hypothetical protein
MDTQCVASGTAGQLVGISNSPALGGLFVTNNEFDGNCGVVENGAVQNSLVNDSRNVATGTGTWQYNYFHNVCNRPVNTINGSFIWQFNTSHLKD